MKYYYSLLEGLVLIFDLDDNRKWAYEVINAKRDLKRYRNVNRILDLFGGRGFINDNVLFQQNEQLRDLGQAWFEELCCYVLKTTKIMLENKDLTWDDIEAIHDEEDKRIQHNQKFKEKYSKQISIYYSYQEEVNHLILEGLKRNNIEKVILKHLKIK